MKPHANPPPPPAAPGEPRPPAPGRASGTGHYENFPVASLLVPRSLRPAVRAIYRFARYADDVADEGDAAAHARLAELERLRSALLGRAEHPEVERLRPHLAAHALPVAEFTALLSAFSQDVVTSRYADFAALRDYCARSADPVGHLVLALFGAHGPRTVPLADAICTALQLINFLQDLAIDWSRGRLYLPLDELAAAGLDPGSVGAAVAAGRSPEALRAVIASQARRCRALLEAGAPLVGQVPVRLAWELRATLAGGARILEQLAANGYDPLARRPKLGWRDAPALLRLTLSIPVAR